MKNKIFAFGVAVFIIVSAKPVSAQKILTLRQCIETGLSNNLDVLQSELTMQGSKVDRNQAKLNLLPFVSGNAGESFNQGRSIDPYSNSPVTQNYNASQFGLNSGVVLFSGLTNQNRIKQTVLAFEASKMDWQQVKDNLTINIILAYLQVLSSDDQLTLARNQAGLSGKQVERLQVLDKEGAIKPADLSTLKGQYAGDQLSIINAENNLETARLSLCQLMNIPYSKDLALEKIDLATFGVKNDDAPDKIYQSALNSLALVKAVDLRKQSAEKALKVSQGGLFPTLSFGFNAFTNYSSLARQSQYINTNYLPTTDSAFAGGTTKYPVYRFQDNFTPPSKIGYKDQLNNNIYTSYGFTLDIPIFNRLQQRSRIKQARLLLRGADLIAKTTRTRLSQSIDLAYVNMVSASGRHKAVLDQVDAYKESFRAAEISFNEGAINSVEYLQVKNFNDQANINLINAMYDYILRSKVLDYYEGKPLW
ncbi:MAG: TolC family protein [Chitinophagaceae bacterium]|nr:TolC family protein [Chitinophagaceae bacterium]